jgi:hypothetical protein
VFLKITTEKLSRRDGSGIVKATRSRAACFLEVNNQAAGTASNILLRRQDVGAPMFGLVEQGQRLGFADMKPMAS